MKKRLLTLIAGDASFFCELHRRSLGGQKNKFSNPRD